MVERRLIFRLIATAACLGAARGLLYPRESESREVKLLDGLWEFRADFSASRQEGFVDKWYSQPLSSVRSVYPLLCISFIDNVVTALFAVSVCLCALQTGEVILMPVPSSWNDITQNVSIKEYIGWVWYEREAWVPASWAGLNIMLRFESAHYNSIAVRSFTAWGGGEGWTRSLCSLCILPLPSVACI